MSGIFYDQNEAVTIIPSIIFSRFPILKFFGPGFSNGVEMCTFRWKTLYKSVHGRVCFGATAHLSNHEKLLW